MYYCNMLLRFQEVKEANTFVGIAVYGLEQPFWLQHSKLRLAL